MPGGVDREDVFPHRFPLQQMFLDDALEDFRRAGVIPDAIRVNDRDRPAQADAQAVDLAAINERLRADEMEMSDWSSDVCSSDLRSRAKPPPKPLNKEGRKAGTPRFGS